MAREDPVWNRMPTSYFEGPFVGNGLLTATRLRTDIWNAEITRQITTDKEIIKKQ